MSYGPAHPVSGPHPWENLLASSREIMESRLWGFGGEARQLSSWGGSRSSRAPRGALKQENNPPRKRSRPLQGSHFPWYKWVTGARGLGLEGGYTGGERGSLRAEHVLRRGLLILAAPSEAGQMSTITKAQRG